MKTTDDLSYVWMGWDGMGWDGMDGWTVGWMDGWTDGWMDGWTDGRMDGWTDGRDGMGWTDGRMGGMGWDGMDGWMDGWMDGQLDGWMDVWMGWDGMGWRDGGTVGWMDGWVGWVCVCVTLRVIGNRFAVEVGGLEPICLSSPAQSCGISLEEWCDQPLLPARDDLMFPSGPLTIEACAFPGECSSDLGRGRTLALSGSRFWSIVKGPQSHLGPQI